MDRGPRRRGRRMLGVWAVLAVLLGAAPARADDERLAKVRTAIEALDYKLARATLAEALAGGTYGPDQIKEIYLLTGVVTGALGDRAASVDAFKKLLSLSPKATLVAGTSPKVAKPFAEASDQAKTSAPLKVTTETAAASVTLVVESDPLNLVAGARVTVVADHGPPQTLDAKGTGRVTVALPAAEKLELRVAALDEHGNRLVELGADAPIVITNAATVKPRTLPIKPTLRPASGTAPHARPIYAQWWLWGGVAVAAAATGTLFGLAARSAGDDLNDLNAHSSDHDFGEAQDVLSRARRDALISNISFGAAGAGAAAAVILFLTRPDARSTERSVTLTPTPVRGGTAITLEVPF